MNTTPKPSPTSCADLREEIKRIVVANTRLIDNRIMLSAELADRVLAAITPAKPVEGDVGALVERLLAEYRRLETSARYDDKVAANLHGETASALASLSQQLADERAKAEQLTAQLREAQEDERDRLYAQVNKAEGLTAAIVGAWFVSEGAMLPAARLAARTSAAKDGGCA